MLMQRVRLRLYCEESIDKVLSTVEDKTGTRGNGGSYSRSRLSDANTPAFSSPYISTEPTPLFTQIDTIVIQRFASQRIPRIFRPEQVGQTHTPMTGKTSIYPITKPSLPN